MRTRRQALFVLMEWVVRHVFEVCARRKCLKWLTQFITLNRSC